MSEQSLFAWAADGGRRAERRAEQLNREHAAEIARRHAHERQVRRLLFPASRASDGRVAAFVARVGGWRTPSVRAVAGDGCCAA